MASEFWIGFICGISGLVMWPIVKHVFWCCWFGAKDATEAAMNLKDGVSAATAVCGIAKIFLYSFAGTLTDRCRGMYRHP